MAERSVDTVTLEMSIQTDHGLRTGAASMIPAELADVRASLHMRRVVASHLAPLPLCWVVEGEQRGATVEEWEVSFDHEALPSFNVVDRAAFVTCQDCKEWIHA